MDFAIETMKLIAVSNQDQLNDKIDVFLSCMDSFRGMQVAIADKIRENINAETRTDQTIQNTLQLLKRLVNYSDYFEVLCTDTFAMSLFEILWHNTPSKETKKLVLQIIQLFAQDQELMQLASIFNITIYKDFYNSQVVLNQEWMSMLDNQQVTFQPNIEPQIKASAS